ncbi:hypothetical protein [Carnobacterium alterfunditum]|nr:hypothetical protein [Carnobacterium alterfunditum]
MMFTHSYKKAIGNDLFLIRPKTIYTFLSVQMDLASLMKQLNRQLDSFPGLISKDAVFIDYLTIRENMLVILSLTPDHPKRALDLVVTEVLEELQISDSLADQHFNVLPLNLFLKLQLRLASLCNKKVILVDDWLDHESASAKQDWLLLFRGFVRNTDCSIIFFTSDEQLLSVENPLRLDPGSYLSKKIS